MSEEILKNELGVLVLMPTYCHANYIENAIEGVLFQKTNFPVELYINDDASTDSTFEKCLKYCSYGNITIRLNREKINIGANQNGAKLREYARNSRYKYVAILEGDDYWTDPYKLQKQVDFLEANPEYSICFHPVQIQNESTGKLEDDPALQIPETTSIIDLVKGNFIHTPSVIFRNGLFDFQDPILAKVPAGDYLIHLLNAQHGFIKKLEESMAVYRKHDQGIWSPAKDKLRHERWVKMMDMMIDYFKDAPELVDAFNVQRAHSMTKINDTLVINKIKHFIKKNLGLTK